MWPTTREGCVHSFKATGETPIARPAARRRRGAKIGFGPGRPHITPSITGRLVPARVAPAESAKVDDLNAIEPEGCCAAPWLRLAGSSSGRTDASAAAAPTPYACQIPRVARGCAVKLPHCGERRSRMVAARAPFRDSPSSPSVMRPDVAHRTVVRSNARRSAGVVSPLSAGHEALARLEELPATLKAPHPGRHGRHPSVTSACPRS